MYKIIEKILDLIFPVKCLACGKSVGLLCPDCFKKHLKKPISVEKLEMCSCRLHVALEDNEISRKLIHELKYKYNEKVLTILQPFLDNLIINKKNSVLIPVPLHKKRLKERGWNQSLKIARITGLPVFDVLERSKNTEHQMKLNKKNRIENVKSAFRCKFSLDGEKTYIIVDDVGTTGSTLEECKKALEKSGARNVEAMLIIRATS